MEGPSWLNKPRGEWTEQDNDQYCRDTNAFTCAMRELNRALREFFQAFGQSIPGLHRLLQWVQRPVDTD